MNIARKLLATVAIAAAALVPQVASAQPGYGYFIVSEYSPYANILAGPFDYDGCQFAMLKGNFKAPAHCEIKVW